MAKYSIEVDTGLVEVDIKDTSGKVIGTIAFNPTDSDIINRYQDVISALNEISAPESMKDGTATHEDVESFYRNFNAVIHTQFDHLLGGDVSKNIFATCGPLTLLNSGEFYYEHVIEGIGGLISKIMEQRMDAKLQRISEAVEKYEHK